jgi:hypothetical protein
MNSNELDDYAVLTEPEVRRLTGLSKITLLRMRKRDDCGGLPYIQLSPGRIGYMRRDTCAYLIARRVGSLPQPAKAA